MVDEPWDPAWAKKLREAGFAAAAVVPNNGLFRGQASLFSLADADAQRNLLRPSIAQVVRIAPREGQGRDYPNSMMGAIALFRQTLLDAGWTARTLARADREPGGELPRHPPLARSLQSLAPALAGEQRVIFETDSAPDALRVVGLAKEFALQGFLVGSGKEYQRTSELARAGWPIAIPLAFPKDPKLSKDSTQPVADEAALGLEELRHWDRAPANAARLSEAGLRFAFTAWKLDSPKDVLAQARKAITAGLPAEKALAALTLEPARLLGLEATHGTLAAGKVANILVSTGDLFAEKTKLTDIWVDGERHALGLPDAKPAGSGSARSQHEEEHP